MKNIFRLFAVFAVLLSCNFTALAKEYTDVTNDHWAYCYIQELSEQNVVVGYPDDSFKPDAPITRAEFATMTIKALHQDSYNLTETVNFNDVDENHWGWENIQRAIYFDLLKGNPNGDFLPDENVSKAHVISVVINSLTTDELCLEDAKEILKENYSDYDSTPDWIIIQAAKAKKLGMLDYKPEVEETVTLDANKLATRADVTALLSKMLEQVKLNPNKKLAEVMPRIADGIVLKGTTTDGIIATIPAGVCFPITLSECISTQTNLTGQLFLAKIPQNLISEEKYLLFDKDDSVSGLILDVKKAKYFIRNGALVLETKSIKTQNNQIACFSALADTKLVTKGFWQKLYRAIVKGKKIEFNNGQSVNVILLKPITVNVSNGFVIENEE